MTKPEPTSGAQSLHRAVAILRLVAANAQSGIRLSELCKRTGLARTTVHRMLGALVGEGLVEQDADTDLYHLGREAWLMGLAAQGRFGMETVAAATLARISAQSGDIALFLVRSGTHAVCIAREEGSYPVRTHTAQVGGRYPLGVGGGSLAILSACPDDEIDWILDSNSAELARDHPRLTPALLREMVAQTRVRGYALNPGLVYPESWGLGLPFHDRQGMVRGAIMLAGVPARIEPRAAEVAQLLRDEVPRLEARLYR
ncbi:IclR family transcriptional regulator [Citreicella sp. C3M06]|uniref:IclR family transcriptional regulator n=1 Tax=Citreicella sp. C3M06 TaxID=2841564 RepID=UPI001C09A1D1|nr:IclR family transcriptional regulator [Citreicella sp. C3M06]MBU2960358.1 IclR family transcriptional regulator [Citreicella sp. C3M06]